MAIISEWPVAIHLHVGLNIPGQCFPDKSGVGVDDPPYTLFHASCSLVATCQIPPQLKKKDIKVVFTFWHAHIDRYRKCYCVYLFYGVGFRR
jgi:hypothetical protein